MSFPEASFHFISFIKLVDSGLKMIFKILEMTSVKVNAIEIQEYCSLFSETIIKTSKCFKISDSTRWKI